MLKFILKYIVLILIGNVILFAQGINLTAQEELDARYSGLAGVHLGFEGTETALSSHPAAISDIDHLWISSQYINRFSSLAKQNNFALGLPLDTFSTLALGFVYFGGDYIARESFFDQPTIESFYDLVFIIAYARQFGLFDLGANIKIIYRKLDQIGLGIQMDVSARYFWEKLQMDIYWRGLIPSSVHWSETQKLESDITEVFLAGSFKERIESIYGNLTVTLQTQGFIHNAPKSIKSEQGGNIGDPESFLKTLKLAAELQFDGGFALRLGFSEIYNLIQFESLYPNYGVGYLYKKYVRVDYSFHLHPELESTHAFSLSFSPWWEIKNIKRPLKKTILKNKLHYPINKKHQKKEEEYLEENEEEFLDN